MSSAQYTILRLSTSSKPTEQQVITAYRKLALVVHPDKNPSPGAKVEFQKLHDAYEAILNHIKRDNAQGKADGHLQAQEQQRKAQEQQRKAREAAETKRAEELARRKKLEAEELARKRKRELESVVEKMTPNIWQEMERQMNIKKMSEFTAATQKPATRIKERGSKEWKSRPVPLRVQLGSQNKITETLHANNRRRKHDSRTQANRIRTEQGKDGFTCSRNPLFETQSRRAQSGYSSRNVRNPNVRANDFGTRHGSFHVSSETPYF